MGSSSSRSKKPKFHRTTIVVAVICEHKGKVLLVQEAKKEVRGKWYLPAGRVQIGETVAGAARRQVLQETGLNIQAAAIFSIEHSAFTSADWIRYGIVGKVTGGDLKTEADDESLKAQWVSFKDLEKYDMRAKDLYTLIRRYKRKECLPIPRG